MTPRTSAHQWAPRPHPSAAQGVDAAKLAWISGRAICPSALSPYESVLWSSSGQNTFSILENIFSKKTLSVFPAEGLFVKIFS